MHHKSLKQEDSNWLEGEERYGLDAPRKTMPSWVFLLICVVILTIIAAIAYASPAKAQTTLGTFERTIVPNGVRSSQSVEKDLAKALENSTASGTVLTIPTAGEKFVLLASFGSSIGVQTQVSVRLEDKLVGKFQPGYSRFANGLAASGGYFGVVTDPNAPLALYGGQQVALSGKFDKKSPFTVEDQLCTPQLDQTSACDAGDGHVILGFRLRGYRPDTPRPEGSVYPLAIGSWSGSMYFAYIQGAALPAPVWASAYVDNATYDQHFAGSQNFRMQAGGCWTKQYQWYVYYPPRAALSSCKG